MQARPRRGGGVHLAAAPSFHGWLDSSFGSAQKTSYGHPWNPLLAVVSWAPGDGCIYLLRAGSLW